MPGFDPIIGAAGAGQRTVNGLVVGQPKVDTLLNRWVVARGGEYFFVPSISTLKDVFAKAKSQEESEL